MIFFKIATAKV